MEPPGDDEAAKDPGAQQPHHQGFSDEDFEGHRAGSVFVGVHIPGNRRHSHHRRHHRHRPGEDDDGDSDRPVPMLGRRGSRLGSICDDGETFTPPSQRVQFILGEDADNGAHEVHPLFSEMGELFQDGDDAEWRETARWIKFEEDVEEGGNRWSKPHVATLSLHSLFELRSLLLHGALILDMEASSLETVADMILDNLVNSESLPENAREKVRETLLRRHRHQHQRRRENSATNMTRLPIIRSLAEIGRNHSTSKTSSGSRSPSPQPRSTEGGAAAAAELSRSHSYSGAGSAPPVQLEVKYCKGSFLTVPGAAPAGAPGAPEKRKALKAAREAARLRVEEQLSVAPNLLGSGLINKPSDVGRYLSIPGGGEGMERSPSAISMPRNHSSTALGELNGEHKSNVQFMRKIPPGAEASNILVGEVDFLDKTIAAFVRLNQASFLGDITEVPVPTRFMFVLLGPTGGIASFHEIGRAMATLMSDEVFHEVAYKARNRNHLLAAVDEFLDAVTVLPPGEWDPSIRIEPPAAIPSQDPRKRKQDKLKDDINPEILEQKLREESGLARTGRLFGGLINDLKRKKPWYISDFTDALSSQCVASWIFLYFACLSPIITFGGLLSEATGRNMAAMESLVSGFVCGVVYGLFSGQPLTILGSTGPVLVFESIVYEFCTEMGWDYMSFRLWIGIWVVTILIILVAIDASAFVCYITRFTEENFATLIAFIFIYKAVENVLSIGKRFPMNSHAGVELDYDCSCVPSNLTSSTSPINWANVSVENCNAFNGTLVGTGCFTPKYVPDVFLMSVILFLGTFLLSVQLKDFKNALFFPSKVRQFISDFAVIIAILSMSLLDYSAGVNTPKLEVPSEFKPTLPNRGWVISPFAGNPVWSILVAPLPAMLGTILIFMDQQITAVIVNRKENKLKKGCGYHLDLFVLANLILICSLMGLPWFVAATVLSINHVNSLKLESECAAPGEKPQFLGVKEQRVTHVLIFVTIGLSVFITPLLSHIPMPVLFGVFLYMGVASLKGLQFFDRILIMFMPAKYQPDYMFLRQVPIMRVHMFTLIQLACLIMLWVIKSFSKTSILFPLMLVVMIAIRKGLDFVFTRRELKILDDIMPETIKRDEDQRQLETADDENLQIPLANGNIMKIPLASINITEEVNKTGIWKQVNQANSPTKDDPKKKQTPGGKNSSKSKKRGNKKDALLDEENKRLSTMAEEDVEDEDEGITIKVDHGRRPSRSLNGVETTV